MYRNIAETMFYFQFEEFYTKESSRGQKVAKVRIFEIFVYIYLSRPSIVVPTFIITKVCSVRFLRLQSQQCPLFETIKVSSVCFFKFQKLVVSYPSIIQQLVVSAFLNYKSQQCLLFQIPKVSSLLSFQNTTNCSVCFLDYKSLQSAFLTLSM